MIDAENENKFLRYTVNNWDADNRKIFDYEGFKKSGYKIKDIKLFHIDEFCDMKQNPFLFYSNFRASLFMDKTAINTLVEKYNLPKAEELSRYRGGNFEYKTLYHIIDQLVNRSVLNAGYCYGGTDYYEEYSKYKEDMLLEKKYPYLKNDPTKKQKK